MISETDEYGYSTVIAYRPWNSIYAEPEKCCAKTPDMTADQRQIDMCLNCPWPDCVGCIDGWKDIRNIAYSKVKRKRRKNDSVRRTLKP